MGQSCSVVDSNSNRKFISSFSTKATSAFNDPKVEKTMSTIHDKYVIVPAEIALNKIVLICKKHYIES
jgi:hypothetical protein